uniref:Uncharacterized protein n=1 Tax=Strombidium inclinatum TaxID=197538 RepID=A0A7S3MV88_9SPIT|mmetsp:Transcript_10348/g.15890  ORF Transcript_10348/g.15890 Transcript_10348/m.15890 type:complete len:173 (+) Transcript_10348:29-547(+)
MGSQPFSGQSSATSSYVSTVNGQGTAHISSQVNDQAPVTQDFVITNGMPSQVIPQQGLTSYSYPGLSSIQQYAPSASSNSITCDGSGCRQMTPSEAAAFNQQMSSWGQNFSNQMSDWSSNFSNQMANTFGNGFPFNNQPQQQTTMPGMEVFQNPNFPFTNSHAGLHTPHMYY